MRRSVRLFVVAMVAMLSGLIVGPDVHGSAADTYMDVLGRFAYTPASGYSLDPQRSARGYIWFTNVDGNAGVAAFSQRTTGSTLDDFVGVRYVAETKLMGVDFPMPGIQMTMLDGKAARQFEHVSTADDGTRTHWLTRYALNGNVVGRLDVFAPVDAWDMLSPTLIASLDSFHFLTAQYPTTFTGGMGTYSFPIPSGWQRDLSISGSSGIEDFFVGFSPQASVDIDVLPVASGVTVDTLAMEEIAAKPDNVTMFQSDQMMAQPTSIGGQPAMQWDYSNVVNNVRYQHRIIWAVSGTNRYRLAISARMSDWKAGLAQAQQLVNGFTFK